MLVKRFKMLDQSGAGGAGAGEGAGGGAGEGGSGAAGNSGSSGGGEDYKALYETAVAKLSTTESEWKAKYAGLQRTLQTEQDNLKAKVTEYTTLKSQFDGLQAEKETVAKTLSEKEGLVGTLEADIKRKSLIMEKFPHLSTFESQGLLPQKPLEELEGALGLFSASLEKISGEARKQHAEGGSAGEPAGKKQSVTSSQMKLHEAQQAAMRGNGAEYQKLYGEYLELSKKEAS